MPPLNVSSTRTSILSNIAHLMQPPACQAPQQTSICCTAATSSTTGAH